MDPIINKIRLGEPFPQQTIKDKLEVLRKKINEIVDWINKNNKEED